MVKISGYLSLLFCLACSSTHPVGGSNVGITSTIITVRELHRFHDATAMSVDQFWNAYVVESSNNSVIKISPNGDSLHEVSGFGDDHYQFNGPCYVDARLSNAVFISDRFNHRIEQYTKDLVYSGTLYTRDNIDPNTRFGYPAAVAADDAGNIYVADGENKRVIKARSDYSIERVIGGFSEANRPDAILSNPVGLAIDADEHLIVLDNGGTSIVEYDNLGNFIARVDLGETARSISTESNEIYALIANRSVVRHFHSNSLSETGSWVIERTDSTDKSPLESFAKRKLWYALSRQAIYQPVITVGDTVLR